ncbi:hypothetical protein Tco_1288913 [Tanacetum coccineum]
MSSSNNSNNSNQQTLAESGANARPPMLEKGNYIPWESRFRRFLDNQLEEGERMWHRYNMDRIKDQCYILQAIPNDIYNSVDVCANAHEMWKRIKRLMHGSDISDNVRHSGLMDEFDKFAAKEGESLESVYEMLTTLVNIMDRNSVLPITDELYDSLVQFKPHVLASRAKKAAKNHDPLALIAHSNASSSHPHTHSSYSP